MGSLSPADKVFRESLDFQRIKEIMTGFGS